MLQILYIFSVNMMREYILLAGIYKTKQYIYSHFHDVSGGAGDAPELVLGDLNQEFPMISFIDRNRKDVFELPWKTEVLPLLANALSVKQKACLCVQFQMDAHRFYLPLL